MPGVSDCTGSIFIRFQLTFLSQASYDGSEESDTEYDPPTSPYSSTGARVGSSNSSARSPPTSPVYRAPSSTEDEEEDDEGAAGNEKNPLAL